MNINQYASSSDASAPAAAPTSIPTPALSAGDAWAAYEAAQAVADKALSVFHEASEAERAALPAVQSEPAAPSIAAPLDSSATITDPAAKPPALVKVGRSQCQIFLNGETEPSEVLVNAAANSSADAGLFGRVAELQADFAVTITDLE